MRRLVLVVLAAVWLAVTTGAAAGDPGAPGPYAVRHLTYRLAGVHLPEFRTASEVWGDVMAPVGAPGPRPLVIVLHGQHRTCRPGPRHPKGFPSRDWPCPKGWVPVPSHEGYRWLTRLLASQGDIAVSISADAVNAQNNAAPGVGALQRGVLVRHHLALWTTWATQGGDPWGGVFQGAVDTSHVVLVGHSRGGEGVAQAAAMALPTDPWRIRGLALIAPTAFGREATPGVDTMVLLPYCDGDVTDLQGQTYVDGRRDLVAGDTGLRSAVLLMGANHNAFNTVWARDGSDGDNWGYGPHGAAQNRVCGRHAKGRLTGVRQRAAGGAFIAALVKAATADDPESIDVLTGRVPAPASAGTARVLVSQNGAGDPQVYAPALTGAQPRAAGMRASVCRAYRLGAGDTCAGTTSPERQPHWVGMDDGGPYPAPLALELTWRARGAVVSLPLTGGTLDATGATAMVVRAVGDAAVRDQSLSLHLVDAAGGTADIPAVTPLVPLPGPRRGDGDLLPKLWAQTLRFPLTGAVIDVAHLVSAGLVSTSARGHVWVLDAALEVPQVRPVAQVTLPQVVLTHMRVRERGSRAFTVRLPVRVLGAVTRPAVLSIGVRSPDYRTTWQTLVIPPGATTASIPVRLPADRVFTGNRTFLVFAVARRDVVVGRYDGWVAVRDDDAKPRSHRRTDLTPAVSSAERWRSARPAPRTGR
ncbi:MAG: hypothetical protein U0Y82_03135 [Thermoleophilia bacterium]